MAGNLEAGESNTGVARTGIPCLDQIRDLSEQQIGILEVADKKVGSGDDLARRSRLLIGGVATFYTLESMIRTICGVVDMPLISCPAQFGKECAQLNKLQEAESK